MVTIIRLHLILAHQIQLLTLPHLILGYEVKNSIRTVEFETAKGSLFAYVFLVAEITALGITRQNMEICSYDFFNNNIFSDMHGVLGLDFFRDCKFCIDMVERVITVTQQ